MPLQKASITFTGSPINKFNQLKNFLINVAGWSDAGNKIVSFYIGTQYNPNVQFTGVKNSTGQILYYNTSPFNTYNYNGGIISTTIMNLSRNNQNNNFIVSTNEICDAVVLFPESHAGATNTNADIFYNDKSFILINKSQKPKLSLMSIHEYSDNYHYKVLGYLEVGGYKVLFNDFFYDEVGLYNFRNIVVLDNNLNAYVNHVYPFNTLVSHNPTDAMNNLRINQISQLREQITYPVVNKITRYTAKVNLIIDGDTKILLPFNINYLLDDELNIVLYTSRGLAHAYTFPVFVTSLNNRRNLTLLIYPDEVN